MKKILAVVAGIVVLLLIAVAVVPRFIDWNRYKGDIAAEARRLTGRDVGIDGDIRLNVLPSPALVVNDLRVANIPGGVEADMARLKQAEVHVALMPLLSGRVAVSRVTLVEPVVALEVLPDGRNNWTFTLEETPPETPPEATEEEPGRDGGPDVRLDEVEIENGVITYHDVAAGSLRRIAQLNATIEAASLQGPIASTGSFTAEGVPLGFDLDVGRFAGEAQVPVAVALTSVAGNTRLAVRGNALDIESDPRFQGRIEAEAGNLASALHALIAEPLPGFLAQRAALAFDLAASAESASIDALALRLGEMTADGAATIDFSEEPSLAAQLAAGTIDLDAWLAMPDAVPPGAQASREDAAATPAPEQPGDAAAFTLPTGVAATVALAVEAIAFNDGVIRQVRADAELADGAVTLSRLSALLPGGAEAAMVGALNAVDGEPAFNGQLEARAADLRSVLRWLDVDVATVPAGGLRTLALTSDIAMTARRVEANNLDLRLDSSTIRGVIGAAMDEPPTVAADLAVDRLNLNAYLPTTAAEPQPTSPPAESASVGSETAEADPLRDLNAEIVLRIAAATYNGAPANDVVVDGGLADGALTLRRASIGDFAGATASASGQIAGLTTRPTMDNVAINFSASDPARLLRALDMTVPEQAQNLGGVSGKGTLNGTPEAPAVDLAMQAAGAEVRLAGTLNPQAGTLYAGRAGFAARDPAPLLSALAVDYRPTGPIGPTDISGAVVARDASIAISELSGQVAGTPVSGSITMTMAGPRPHMAADLATGRLVVDPLLPADQAASVPAMIVPAAWSPSRAALRAERRPEVALAAAADVHGRWSRELIDLSALRDVDADIRLRSEAIVYQGYTLANADLTAALAGGVLNLEPVRGSFFGGPFTGSARVDATGTPAVSIALTVEGADLGQAPATPQGIAGGRLNADARLATRGTSIADFVAALGGGGSLAVQGLDPAVDASGVPVLGPVLGSTLRLAGALDTALGPLLGLAGGRTGPGLADISAPFTVEQGVARLDPIRVHSPIYEATARGTANLAAWQIDLAGEMTLAQSAIGALLGGVKEVPSRCTFAARGPMDKPNVQIGGECIPRGIAIPGTGEGGLGGVLERLIPKEMLPQRGEQPPQPQEPAPETAPQQAPQPEKVIRDLLEGFIRR